MFRVRLSDRSQQGAKEKDRIINSEAVYVFVLPYASPSWAADVMKGHQYTFSVTVGSKSGHVATVLSNHVS